MQASNPERTGIMDAHEGTSGDIFERLWLLRACYLYRSDYDARSVLSVDEAIEFGEELLRAAHRHERWSGFGQRYRSA